MTHEGVPQVPVGWEDRAGIGVMELQVTTSQVNGERPLGSPAQDAGDRDGRGTGAAGPGFAAPPLPGALDHLGWRDDLRVRITLR